MDIVWFSRLVQPLRFISTNSFLRNVFDVVNHRFGLQVSFRCSEFGELVLCEIVRNCGWKDALPVLPLSNFRSISFWYPLSVIRLSQKWTSLLKFLCNCLVSHFITIDYFLMSWYYKSVFDSLWRKNASMPLIYLTYRLQNGAVFKWEGKSSHAIGIATLCDLLNNFAPAFEPWGSKTETNRTLYESNCCEFCFVHRAIGSCGGFSK